MKLKNEGFEEAVSKFSISPTAAVKGQLGWLNA